MAQAPGHNKDYVGSAEWACPDHQPPGLFFCLSTVHEMMGDFCFVHVLTLMLLVQYVLGAGSLKSGTSIVTSVGDCIVMRFCMLRHRDLISYPCHGLVCCCAGLCLSQSAWLYQPLVASAAHRMSTRNTLCQCTNCSK